MLYCLVCFYKEDLSGGFTVDYMFRDKTIALQTLLEYNRVASGEEKRRAWMQLFFYDQVYVPKGDDGDYYVYLNMEKKKIKIFVDEQKYDNYRHRLLPLPPIETSIPDEFVV